MELSQGPASLSALIGTSVVDQNGRSLGRVYEVRAGWEDDQLVLRELLVGRGGLLRRLSGPGPRARGVAWDAVIEASPERIVAGS